MPRYVYKITTPYVPYAIVQRTGASLALVGPNRVSRVGRSEIVVDNQQVYETEHSDYIPLAFPRDQAASNTSPGRSSTLLRSRVAR
jgi:hypothetical protein